MHEQDGSAIRRPDRLRTESRIASQPAWYSTLRIQQPEVSKSSRVILHGDMPLIGGKAKHVNRLCWLTERREYFPCPVDPLQLRRPSG